MSLPFSSFGLAPEPGSSFLWRLSGETLDPAGGQQAYCAPTPWRAFMIGQSPALAAPPWTFPVPEMQDGCFYTAIRNPICRASDYADSTQIAILQHGELAELIALNPELTHGKFELASTQQCWISLGVMDGPDDPIETCGVPEVDPQPRPADPQTPASCTTDLDREACEASGGEWTGGATTAPICTCPSG